VPRHPPNALLTLENTWPSRRKAVHHARKPSTETAIGEPRRSADRQCQTQALPDNRPQPAAMTAPRRPPPSRQTTRSAHNTTQYRSAGRIPPRAAAPPFRARPHGRAPMPPTDRSNAPEHSPRRRKAARPPRKGAGAAAGQTTHPRDATTQPPPREPSRIPRPKARPSRAPRDAPEPDSP
jgi:hypothetical protein